jgi:ABC-type multidrug transport system ATPase subunit
MRKERKKALIVAEVKGLRKNFGKKEVLTNINLKFEAGRIYGLFGKNGAGKTTLIRIFLGILSPTEGEAYIFGKKPEGNLLEVGYLPENLSGYVNMNAFDNIDVIAKMMGISLNKTEIMNILDRVNLKEAAYKKIKDFSLGMRRRLQLAFAMLIGEKELMFLDEPTNGLDIEGSQWLKEELKRAKTEGKTIVLSSHSLNEMEEVVDEFIIIHNGEIKRQGTIQQLVFADEKMVKVKEADKERMERLLKSYQFTYRLSEERSFAIKEKEETKLLEIMVNEGIYPEKIEESKISLENIFNEVTKE